MGQKSVKVVLKKVTKQDEKASIRISIRENNKTSIKNIKLPPIEVKYWHPLRQVVKSTFPQYKFYNDKIARALEELKTTNEVGLITSKLCSIIRTVFPLSTNLLITSIKIRMSSKCKPVVGSSKI